MRGRVGGGVLLVVLGVVKLPLERRASGVVQDDGLLTPMAGLELRENLSQASFAAVLGGLRSLVASVTYMQGYLAFEDVLWAKVDRLFSLTARLQPRTESYWDEGSWHMAFNAASHYLHDAAVPTFTRGELYHQHVARGEQILEDGLRFNPESARLWGRLGDIYARRSREPVKAGEAYLKAAETGPAFYERLAAYQFLQGPDEATWRRAYELLRKAYDAGKKYPSVIDGLKDLERRLAVPTMQRIPEAGSGAPPAVKQDGPLPP